MAMTERRRGITVYRAADVPDLQATDFMSAPSMSEDTCSGLGPGSWPASGPAGW